MSKFIDYTGTIHGRLTAVEYLGPSPRDTGSLWRCKCICGGERICDIRSLKRGTGCAKCNRRSKDRPGHRYLDATCAECNKSFLSSRKGTKFCSRSCKKRNLSRVDRRRRGIKERQPRIYRLCKCGCGKNVDKYDRAYLTGHRVVVPIPRGIRRLSLKYASKEGYIRSLFQTNKKRRRRITAKIPKHIQDTVATNAPSNCPICNTELHYGKSITQADRWRSPSLDRLDSDKGYDVTGNVFVICLRCNTIKSFGTIEDHERIAAYMKAKLTPASE